MLDRAWLLPVCENKEGGKIYCPAFFFFCLKDNFLILKATDAFCILNIQNIQIILKCSGERAFSFELSSTLDLHELTAADLVGSWFCYGSVTARLLKHSAFCKQYSSAAAAEIFSVQ